MQKDWKTLEHENLKNDYYFFFLIRQRLDFWNSFISVWRKDTVFLYVTFLRDLDKHVVVVTSVVILLNDLKTRDF